MNGSKMTRSTLIFGGLLLALGAYSIAGTTAPAPQDAKPATEAKAADAPARPAASTPEVAKDLFLALFSFGGVLLLLSILPEKLTDFAKSALGLEKRDTLKELYGWTDYGTVLDPAKTPDQAALTAYRQLYRLASANESIWLWSPTDIESPTSGLFDPIKPVEVTLPNQVNMALIRDHLITLDTRMRDLESSRVARLRIGSAGLGMAVAWLLNIDAFLLLRHAGIDVVGLATAGVDLAGAAKVGSAASHAAVDLATATVKASSTTASTAAGAKASGPSSMGILLTGLGAGMGAPFWQDFLDTLTKYKDKLTPPKVG